MARDAIRCAQVSRRVFPAQQGLCRDLLQFEVSAGADCVATVAQICGLGWCPRAQFPRFRSRDTAWTLQGMGRAPTPILDVVAVDDLPLVSDGAVEEALDLLNVQSSRARAQLAHHLRAHANSFAFARHLETLYPTVHENRTAMGALAEQVAAVRKGLDGLNPIYLGVLQIRFEELTGQSRAWDSFASELKALHSLLLGAGSAKLAKKRSDTNLRNAVGGLMLLLENATGNRARGRARDPITKREPEFANAEAMAIGKLLQAVDKRLQVTTLVTTINNIRRKHKGEPLKTYAHQLMVAGRIVPH